MMEEEDDKMAREMMGITAEGRIERRIKDEEDYDQEEEDDKNIPGSSSSSALTLKPSVPKLGMDDSANTRKRNEQKDRFAGIKLIKKAKPSEPSTASSTSSAPSTSSTPATSKIPSVPAPSGLSLLAEYGSDSDSD